ncbi:MAG: NADH-quinone oxidoreductase subunit L [Gemmatimonadaceae bacterium]|nr:NADH-quinone oxidoreductase subunit L [Gemmatimonadaceae bacterium]
MTVLSAGILPLIQHAAPAAGAHPLAGTVADWLWLVPLLPLLGFVINGALSLFAVAHTGPSDPDAGHGDVAAHDHADAGHTLPGDVASGSHGDDHHPVARHRFAGIVSVVGPLMLALSFVLTAAMFFAMRSAHATEPFIQTYFTWMITGELNLAAAFQLDQLAMVMMLVITGVGTLIHVFSVGYMRDDPGYPRYFAYLNLFVFFMLVLVMGANYPVMFIGWEGVGLCSYLLIGFWFSEKANADAGKKAFIVNRIGDFGFLVALMMLFAHLGTMDFQGVAAGAPQMSTGVVTAICLFLFLGCVGKSAQIPLYVWLPDAMAGPTPVSALIHAATMVTAGVYLVARSSFLFSLAPVAGLTVALTGALTALFAATIGLKQWDIKKILAYSTVSQLGFMFMAVGVGAYVAGIFHLATHAFFKALLFLGSGSVIYAMHAAYHKTGSHEDAQDVRNMGGLRRFMPVTWVLMWIATLAIAGIPPFAGFFSKDEILTSVYARAHGSTLAEASWLGIPGSALLYFIYFVGIVTALLTAIYMTRMMLYTFHGPNRTGEAERGALKEAPWVMTGPLVLLGVLSAFGGWFNLPKIFTDFLPVGPTFALEHWLDPVVGEQQLAVTHGEAVHLSHGTELLLIGAAIVVAIAGIVVAWRMLKPEKLVPKADSPADEGFERIFAEKYFVDEGYDRAIVQPLYRGSRGVLWRGVDAGLIDGFFVNGTAWLARAFGWLGSTAQTGAVGTYAWVVVLGVVAVIGVFTLR